MATIKKSASRTRASDAGRIEVENVNVPGHRQVVDATMYQAMKRAMLEILPSKPPGLTQTEMRKAVVSHLPSDLFPGGAKAEWWSKLVRLDLEAKGIVRREDNKPLRWHVARKSSR
jgi:hypothetical protein